VEQHLTFEMLAEYKNCL